MFLWSRTSSGQDEQQEMGKFKIGKWHSAKGFSTEIHVVFHNIFGYMRVSGSQRSKIPRGQVRTLTKEIKRVTSCGNLFK